MAKAIRWKVPFANYQGVKYEVQIWDNYTVAPPPDWPTTLQGGSSPFVTQEDASDDLFTPVRAQSGTMQLLDVDGSLMEALHPSNNTEHMVRLKNLDSGDIEWQGFMSAESYNQDYVGYAHIVEFPLISTIEAMDSLFVSTNRTDGIREVRKILGDLFYGMDAEVGFTTPNGMVRMVYYSKESQDIFVKYIDTSILYSEKEIDDEGVVTFEEKGKSYKEVIEIICKYMGWVCMERGTSLYFIRIGEESGWMEQSVEDLATNDDADYYASREEVSIQQKNVGDMEWWGVNHQISITEGARSVEVVANVDPYKLDLSTPRMPGWDVGYKEYQLHNGHTFYGYGSTAQQFNSRFTFYNRYVDNNQTITDTGTATDVYEDSPLYSAVNKINNKYIGAIMGKIATGGGIALTDGVMVSGYQSGATGVQEGTHLFKMSTLLPFTAYDGEFELGWQVYGFENEGNSYSFAELDESNHVTFALRWNGLYLTEGGTWSMTFNTIQRTCLKGGQKVRVPITTLRTGIVELLVFGTSSNSFNNFFFTNLSVKYNSAIEDWMEDEGNLHYYDDLGTRFRDDVSVNVALGTYQHNPHSAGIILNGNQGSITPSQYLTYVLSDDSTETRRPEADLLRRLGDWYAYKRRRLNLTAELPDSTVAPLAIFTGLENTPKKYMLVSESRNWAQAGADLMLIETI